MLFRALFTMLLLLGLSACQSTTGKSDFDTKYDFSQLKRFHFIEVSNQGDQLSAERIRASIRANLLAKNFIEQVENDLAVSGEATGNDITGDFGVSYAFLTKDKPKSSGLSIGLGTGTSGSNGGIGIGTSMGIPIGSDSAKIQVIQIDIIDLKDNRLIWRGTDEYDFESGGNEKVTETTKTINTILAQFPPQAAVK
ncbi:MULTISPECIES: DUF4136 domain-containing protein [unclassified Shewanella]|uniref:DUF4136 domain-containing protein n=1 Tax=unclassified Shewanella TaxID=196818 RepID=UPI000C82969F|nr:MULTISPECIES: DUF4136 domain-containing protein [unclassified Shewanella]MDO6619201.1 DUF4136 domain-containing protein [Shewanella sp. 6_MG-2023]MDO6638873.1 DUF4136 domain-containing protein [Shewanella sp. 5_MG-2023]MDO6677229.1 DUF4136 domain-containing protein [Shewanella sp. 4_MG-2023]MDO6773891.1 DUF4136 domain-containing protein [Shewanella sp. 3_MG-2023]PMG31590.1 hypothetical protein BCU94_07610 [Shewanella sp. 10N.286.52.C2]